MDSSFRSLILRALVCGWVLIGLYGCGGGGDGDTSSTAPRISLDRSSVSFVADTSGQAAALTVHLQTANVPNGGFYYRYRWIGTAVASVSWSSSANGADLMITPFIPNILGAGNYGDTVHIEVCSDSNCTTQFANSPADINVSYTVTGNPKSSVTFSLTATSLNVESKADGTLPTTSVTQSVLYLLPSNAVFALGHRTNSVINNVYFSTQSFFDLQWTLELKGKSVVSAGMFNESVAFSLCFDSTCANRSVDSPQYLSLAYNVLAEQGSDYTLLKIPMQPLDLKYESIGGKLYALTYDSKLVQIDPVSGATVALALPGDPSTLAISGNGQFGFVVLRESSSGLDSITQVELSSMSIVRTTNIGTVPYSSSICSIAPAPGTADRLAVSIGVYASSREIDIYEGGQKISSVPFSSTSYFDCATSLTWASSAKLYYYSYYSDRLFYATFDGTSLHEDGNVALFSTYCTLDASACMVRELQYFDGKLYSNSGIIYDVNANAVAGALPLTSAMVFGSAVANAHGYFLHNTLDGARIRSFDLDRRKPIVDARLPSNTYWKILHLVAWGEDGLAFFSSNDVVILHGNFVTQAYNPNNNWDTSVQSALDRMITSAAKLDVSYPSLN